ncbi:MAG: polyprenyl synthetase family protein [Spirochaetota bacterium]|nr:polyprenyl synthetase family protein [Spirochaetota bacterium]
MKQIIEKYTNQIKEYINEFLNQQGDHFSSINSWGDDLITRLRRYSSNGKLLRGSLVLLVLDLYKHPIDENALKISSALELFHSALLIHDDIMDNDKLRRGLPAMHYQFQQFGESRDFSDAKSFGSSMGICVGDMCIFLGFILISSLTVNSEYKSSILELISREFASVGLGQMQDVYFSHSPVDPTEEDICQLYLYKTARYSFSLPLCLGGMLVSLPVGELNIMEKFGEALGIIFQIKDDELELFGNMDGFGKPVGSDIEEGKKTLYYTTLMRLCTEDERKNFLNINSNKNITIETIRFIQDIMEKYHIHEIIKAVYNQYQLKAQEFLSELELEDKDKLVLQDLISYNLKRTR